MTKALGRRLHIDGDTEDMRGRNAPIRSLGLVLPALFSITTRAGIPLIVDSGEYSQEVPFPYKKSTLPKAHWAAFTYNPLRPEPCTLVRTSVSVKFEENESDASAKPYMITYMSSESGAPSRRQSGFFIYGLDLLPGPFDCATLESEKGVVGMANLRTDDESLKSEAKLIAVFKLHDHQVGIAGRSKNGKTQLILEYGKESQVLLESPLLKYHMELNVELICDIDHDGKPDAIVSFSRGRYISTPTPLKLYLSSKAEPGKLVGEAASY
jgi:hypothetical protein